MKLQLDPSVKCTLELRGRRVELTGADLAALKECLPDTGQPVTRLPAFRDLFASAMLAPSELRVAPDAVQWDVLVHASCLSPYSQVVPTFVNAGAGESHLEPSIHIFLDPSFADLLTGLTGVLKRALERMVKGCAVRGVPFDRASALRVLHDAAARWLDGEPDAARWFEWRLREAGGLDLRVRPQARTVSEAPAYATVALDIRVKRPDGRAKQAGVQVALAELPSVARVMDVLRAGVRPGVRVDSDPGLAKALEIPAVRRVLGALQDAGALIPRDQAPPVYRPPASDAALAATHMGHACAIVDAGERRVLVDPWLFAWDASFDTQPATSAQLGRVDAIFYTHHHEDHLDPVSLMTLPHDVPVYIPEEGPHPHTPRIADYLAALGFRDVRRLAHGAVADLGDGLSVEAVPFFGEGQNRLGFGGNCYLVSRRGRSMLFHADASPDSDGGSLVSSGALAAIVARRGPIDVIFGSWWQERRFLIQLSPLALASPAVQASQWLDDTENCDCPEEFLRRLVTESGAQLFLFYAESASECFLPPERMSPYIPSVSFTWRSREEVRAALAAGTSATVVQAHPYLRVVIDERGAPRVEDGDVAPSRRRSESGKWKSGGSGK